jgi:hypothetical protein
MRKHGALHAISVAVLLLLGIPAANSQTPTRVGPDRLYPDPAMTPGKADTVSLADLQANWECPTSIHKTTCTYSQSHRSVPEKEHNQVDDNYNVPQKQRNKKGGEVDHFDPLCNGGSNDIANLWVQPAKNKWNNKNYGYHEKDALETWVCDEVKKGMLDPAAAYQRLTTDWVKYYMEVKPTKSNSPE